MGCDSFGGGVGDVADGETAGVLVLPPHGKAWQQTQNREERKEETQINLAMIQLMIYLSVLCIVII